MNKRLTPLEIESIVHSGEGYNAEFKIRVPNKVKELTEEVCAFANSAGGVLLIGVNDSNEIKGVSIDNVKRSAIQNSLNEITPHLACSLFMVDIDGKSIGVIEVPSGLQKPYVLSGAIYVRIGPKRKVRSRVKILEIMIENPEVTLPQLAELLGITKRSVEKQVANLKKEGLLQRVGSDKTGSWSVSENLSNNE